ncbi:MAG: acyl-CoA dehydrogenase [Deltaproteobacteria bacterium]|nr:acyl-CoA dehydrogenase [Deltaproteobacteria bacterium]
MDLALTEEQQMIVDMTQGILEEHSTIEVVRQLEDDPKGYPDELWKQLAESGLTGLLIPESFGGGGQGLVEAALVYEQFGTYLSPVPHFVSSVLSARMLLEVGTDHQQEEWLGKMANGDAILSVAWLEPERGFGQKGVQMAAVADGGDFLLSGVKQHVYFASAASQLIVLARTEAGIELFLVDPTAQGVAMRQQLSQSGDAQYRVEFDNVRVSSSARLGGAGTGWETFNQVLHEGIILLAAQAIGGAQKVLDITVEYSKERIQFDKPLGAFQALAHYMADCVTNIDGGRVLVYEAAWNAAQGRSISRFAPMAKLFACETYREVTRICAQIWGGVAFTIEYDCQLYFRRAKQLQLSWWDTPYLEELVAADVLDQE